MGTKIKKIMFFALGSLLCAICLVGCGRNIETETIETVTLNIEDIYHRNSWVQVVPIGKAVTSIYHSEINEVKFDYNGYDISVNDEVATLNYQ